MVTEHPATPTPTRLYGYTSDQENVAPANEEVVLDRVFQRFYSVIPKVIVPVDASNFDRFGASTTPTLVLANKQGIVTLYHPGSMTEQSLKEALQVDLP